MTELITYGSTLTGGVTSESNENEQGGEATKALAEKSPGKQHEEPNPPAPAQGDNAATAKRTTKRPQPQPLLQAQTIHAQKCKQPI